MGNNANVAKTAGVTGQSIAQAVISSPFLFSYQFRGDLRDLLIDWQAEQSEATANRIRKYVLGGEV